MDMGQLLPPVNLVTKILAGVVSALTIWGWVHHRKRRKDRKLLPLVFLIPNSPDKVAIASCEILLYSERLKEYIRDTISKQQAKSALTKAGCSPTTLEVDVCAVVWESRAHALKHERGDHVRSSLNDILRLAQAELNRRFDEALGLTEPDEWIELLQRRRRV